MRDNLIIPIYRPEPVERMRVSTGLVGTLLLSVALWGGFFYAVYRWWQS